MSLFNLPFRVSKNKFTGTYKQAAGAAMRYQARLKRARDYIRNPPEAPKRQQVHSSQMVSGRVGRSMVMRKKRKTRRNRRLRRYRARKRRSFRRKVLNAQFPARKFRSIAFDKMIQPKNQQIIVNPFIFPTFGHVDDMAQDLGLSASWTASTQPGMFVINRFGFDMELNNFSPSVTYIQCYWFQCKDSTTTTPLTLITSDQSQYSVLNHTVNISDLTSRITDYGSLFRYYKVIKKEYLVMEPNSNAKLHFKWRKPKYCNGNYMKSTDTYIRNFTVFPIFRVWSQLVKNSGDDNFVMDNAVVGLKCMQWANYSLRTKVAHVPPKVYCTSNTVSAPQVLSDLSLLNT